MKQLGDVKHLSPNASAMLKVAVFTAWAELQVSSVSQAYLVEVIRPHLPDLAPFWISCLKEFAKIDTDPETAGLSAGGPGPVVNESLESEYAAEAREAILPYYNKSWIKILNAVSVLMDQNDEAVLLAMDGKSLKDGKENGKQDSTTRSEPAYFFYVLYGLAFQALSSSSGSTSFSSHSESSSSSNNSQTKTIALNALRCLSKNQYSGQVLLKSGLFEELYNLSFRLVAIEDCKIKKNVVGMIAGLVESYGDKLLDSQEPLESV